MAFDFIFRQGLPGKYLYKRVENREMARSTMVIVYYFCKHMFLEVPDEK